VDNTAIKQNRLFISCMKVHLQVPCAFIIGPLKPAHVVKGDYATKKTHEQPVRLCDSLQARYSVVRLKVYNKDDQKPERWPHNKDCVPRQMSQTRKKTRQAH